MGALPGVPTAPNLFSKDRPKSQEGRKLIHVQLGFLPTAGVYHILFNAGSFLGPLEVWFITGEVEPPISNLDLRRSIHVLLCTQKKKCNWDFILQMLPGTINHSL